MSFPYDSASEDYEAHVDIRRTCKKCYSETRNLQDGWCPRCNGLDDDADVRAANLAAWEKFYREHPEFGR